MVLWDQMELCAQIFVGCELHFRFWFRFKHFGLEFENRK